MANQYNSQNLTAAVTEASVAVNVESVLFIANDSLVGDLYLNFEATMAVTGDKIVLKPGEILKGIDLQVSTLYYKCSSGTVPFRFVGLNR